MENEIWKMYPEFSFIQVSNLGRVRTLDRVITCGNGARVVKGRILKQQRFPKGYLYVTFSMNGKTVNRSVHRLVAKTFIPNPDNLPEVNHRDNDRTDNNVDNLEWCTPEYNIEYREKYGTSAKKYTKVLNRPVYAVNLKTSEVSRFESQTEAARQLDCNQGNIHSVIKGNRNQANGYWFVRADSSAVESTKSKFGDEVADQVEELMNELQPA